MSADSVSSDLSVSIPVLSVPWTVLGCRQVISARTIGTKDDWVRSALLNALQAFSVEIMAAAAKHSCGIANRWIAISWRPMIYRPDASIAGDVILFELAFAIVNPAASIPVVNTVRGVKTVGELFSPCTSWTFGDFAYDGFWNPARCPLHQSVLATLQESTSFSCRWSNREDIHISMAKERPIELWARSCTLAEASGESAKSASNLWLERSYHAAISRVLRSSFGSQLTSAKLTEPITEVVVFALTDLAMVLKVPSGCVPSVIWRALFALFPTEISVGCAEVLSQCTRESSKLRVLLPSVTNLNGSSVSYVDQFPGEPNLTPEFNLVNRKRARVAADGFSAAENKLRTTTKITRKSILDTLGAADD